VSGTISAIPVVGFFGAHAGYSSPPSSRNYAPGGAPSYTYQSADNGTVSDGPTYSGNGYIIMQTLIGYDVYGGGVRVKRLKTSNSANEVYVQEYTYENGVATGEMDRFEFPRLKTYAKNYTVRYGFMEPKNYERFEMSLI